METLAAQLDVVCNSARLIAAESSGPTTMPFAPRFSRLFMSVICWTGSPFELTGARISMPMSFAYLGK